MFRSDLVLMCSDFEKMIMDELYSVPNMLTLPPIIDSTDIEKAAHELEKIDTSKSFHGNLLFQADFGSVEGKVKLKLLLEEIWPRIQKQIPDMMIDVIGQGINKDILDLCATHDSVRVVVRLV